MQRKWKNNEVIFTKTQIKVAVKQNKLPIGTFKLNTTPLLLFSWVESSMPSMHDHQRKGQRERNEIDVGWTTKGHS